MSTPGFKKVAKAAGPQCRIVYGTFSVNGSNAPVLTVANGIKSVSRTGTGAFLVTLDEGGKNFVADVSQSFSTATVAVVGTKTPSSKTIVINTVTAGSATNADPAAGTIDLTVFVQEV